MKYMTLLLFSGLLISAPVIAADHRDDDAAAKEQRENDRKIQAYLEQAQQPEPHAYMMQPAQVVTEPHTKGDEKAE